MTWYTTLNAIRAHSPCKSGWKKLLDYVGKTAADDEKLALSTILESNGLDDTIWCLRAVEGKDKEIRLFAVWCIRQVEHLPTDQRSKDALVVAEKYANGEVSKEECEAAANAAYAPAYAAADALAVAAYAAADVAYAAAYAAYAAADAANVAYAAADVAYAAADALAVAARAADVAYAAAYAVAYAAQLTKLKELIQ